MRTLILALSISLTLIFSVAFADSQQTGGQAKDVAGQESKIMEEVKPDTSTALVQPKTMSETQKKKLIKMRLLIKMMATDP